MQNVPAYLQPIQSICSRHALLRISQRHLPSQGILATLDWGHRRKVGKGLWKYVVGRRQVLHAAYCGEDIRDYVGLTVVSNGALVVTAYWGGR